MKKILLIQSRCTPKMITEEQEGFRKIVGSAYALDAISSLDESHAWNNPHAIVSGYDAVFFGGSGDFDFDGGRHEDDCARTTSQEIKARLSHLVVHLMYEAVPLLGICYGHQIVGEVLGVRVRHDETQKKIGSHPVVVTEEGMNDPIFSKLPTTFFAQYAHKDSLESIPEGATVLARSHCCKASALRFGNHAYTMQFHPELTHDDVAWKLRNTPGYLPEGVEVESIVKPSSEASRIIPLFLETVVK